MKGIGADLMAALVVGVLLPAVALRLGTLVLEKQEVTQVVTEQTQPPTVETEPVSQMKVLFQQEGGAVEMNMDEYLVGAVLAEMPVSFHMEALKAQAVAARTYGRKALATGGKHGDGSVCASFACCQAYISPEEYLEKGGTEENIARAEEAVLATSGEVLTFEGGLIEATYFSCSGGRTEEAVAVWGTDFPYLRSVESPGEENAAWYQDTVSFTAEEFSARLGVDLGEAPIGAVSYTAGGGVENMEIGGTSFRGTELRSLLGLRSTAFSISIAGDTITIYTRGFGHRVGMSQYGADAMGETGSTYRQILDHYYPGTLLEKWEE